MSRIIKHTPRRLDSVFANYDAPLYFVTFRAWHGRQGLACGAVHEAMIEYGHANAGHGRALGRFVIMPDHVHLFCRLPLDQRLDQFIRLLKQRLGRTLAEQGEPAPYWQPGFFDRLLRKADSYTEKWDYVRENPVRKKLVACADDWPYQGEVVIIRF